MVLKPSEETLKKLNFAAWKRGKLKHLARKWQSPLYDALWNAIKSKGTLKYALNCARRWGKSTLLCLIAIEFALQNPGAQIRFAAPTAKALKKITNPLFKMILTSCPEELKPKYRTQDQVWVFYNDSEIHMAGTDNGNAESLRGTASDLNIIDEAGFCSDLDYVYRDILMPQTLTTGGTTLFASTPPRSPAHDYVELYNECEAAGNSTTYTIYDNESIDEETIKLYIKESGGQNSSTWKREYLAEFIIDENSAIIPEWKPELTELTWEPAEDDLYGFYHKYESMDIGFRHLTALLFGYYDFRRATLVVEDEMDMHGPSMNTELLADKIKAKELELWGEKPPFRRVADNNNLNLIQDLSSIHSLYFMATNKESLEAMVNEVRLFVQNGRIKISPKCKKLLGCLKSGVWNKKRDKFEESKAYGHFDHLAALVYLVRNLAQHSNPIPPDYRHTVQTFTEHVHPLAHDKSSKALSEAFSVKPKKFKY